MFQVFLEDISVAVTENVLTPEPVLFVSSQVSIIICYHVLP